MCGRCRTLILAWKKGAERYYLLPESFLRHLSLHEFTHMQRECNTFIGILRESEAIDIVNNLGEPQAMYIEGQKCLVHTTHIVKSPCMGVPGKTWEYVWSKLAWHWVMLHLCGFVWVGSAGLGSFGSLHVFGQQQECSSVLITRHASLWKAEVFISCKMAQVGNNSQKLAHTYMYGRGLHLLQDGPSWQQLTKVGSHLQEQKHGRQRASPLARWPKLAATHKSWLTPTRTKTWKAEVFNSCKMACEHFGYTSQKLAHTCKKD